MDKLRQILGRVSEVSIQAFLMVLFAAAAILMAAVPALGISAVIYFVVMLML